MCSIIRVSSAAAPGQRDLGEEAQAAEVHREHRHVAAGARDAPRGGEQRAVAAEDDDQVHLRGQRVGRHDAMPTAAFHGRARLVEHWRDLPRQQPVDQVSQHPGPAVEAGLDDDADAADGRGFHGRQLITWVWRPCRA
jgi:hypothetical protein